MLDTSEAIAIFSDGSCATKDRIGGWAWVAVDAFDGIEMGTGQVFDCTNNQMELQAVIEGLNAVYEKYGAQHIMVHSDSTYVVHTINNDDPKIKVNHQFWDALRRAIKLHKIVLFVHVKGHDDNLYNELADTLAKKARKR